jgi:hypothetical protein
MAKIYYELIIAEKMTIDKVPTRWRKAVEEMLEKNKR